MQIKVSYASGNHIIQKECDNYSVQDTQQTQYTVGPTKLTLYNYIDVPNRGQTSVTVAVYQGWDYFECIGIPTAKAASDSPY